MSNSKGFNTDVVYAITSEAKGGSLEIGNIYFKNVPVTYAQVLKAGKKYNSEDTAYQLNLFINQESMDKLDAIGINKELAEVGVTKIKKGQNRGKFKYPLDEMNSAYEGMFGAQFTRNTVKRDNDGAITKEYTPLKVLGSDGKPFTQEVGNGSVCNIKMFAYRNSDGMLVVMLDTVVVLEHVPYNRESEYFDEELGIMIKMDEAPKESPVDAELMSPPKQAKPEVKKQEPETEYDESLDIPF
tara:strand:+ start:27351 stop:28076 length:726 start_codon:yes stop_codon:yes gene_type:complete